MANDDRGSIEPSSDHPVAVKRQPFICCTLPSLKQLVHSEEDSHNRKDYFPSVLNSWFCQQCLFWGQLPEHHSSFSHKVTGRTEVNSQESYPKERCKLTQHRLAEDMLTNHKLDVHTKEGSHSSSKKLPRILNSRFCQLCLFWRQEPDHQTYFSNRASINEGHQEGYPKELLPKTINMEMELGENSHLDHPGYGNADECALLSPNSVQSPLPYAQPTSEPPKLQNFGNTCFFNAALQGIICTNELHTLYVMKPYNVIRTMPEPTMNVYTHMYKVPSKTCDDPLSVSVTSTPGPLTTALNMLLWKTHETCFISSTDLLTQLGKRNPRFARGRQEDSHEALKCIFDALKDEEIQPVKRHIESLYLRNLNAEKRLKLKDYLRMAEKVPTAIGQVIEGKIMSFRICHECRDVSESIESFFDISLPMPNNGSRPKNINGVRDVHVEWQAPNTQTAIPSDAILASNTNNNNNSAFAELDAMLAELDALLVPDTDPPNSRLQNTSLLLTELATPSALTNGHLPNNSEGSDAGQFISAANWQSFANTVDQNLHSASQQTMYQGQQPQHKHRNNENFQRHNYLITHDKDHFQEYLSKEGLHHQLKSKRIQHDMSDLQLCLSLFTDLDVLDENNKFVCKACTSEDSTSGGGQLALCRVSKQLMIHELPPVLILHMKRFEISYEVRKDDRHISFPEILDMAPYCSSKCVKELGDSRNRILYGLYAVIVHLGDSLYNGHYTAFVKIRPVKDQNLGKVEHGDYDKQHCQKGQWYFTSDTYVRKCSLEEVKKSKAYVLFYERLPFIPIHDATMV